MLALLLWCNENLGQDRLMCTLFLEAALDMNITGWHRCSGNVNQQTRVFFNIAMLNRTCYDSNIW